MIWCPHLWRKRKYFLTIHIKACNNSCEIVFLFLIFDIRTNVFNLILLIAFIKINDRPINKKKNPNNPRRSPAISITKLHFIGLWLTRITSLPVTTSRHCGQSLVGDSRVYLPVSSPELCFQPPDGFPSTHRLFLQEI